MPGLALKSRRSKRVSKRYCPKCGHQLGAISQQLGKTMNERKQYCLKCADIIEGRRDAWGFLVAKSKSGR